MWKIFIVLIAFLVSGSLVTGSAFADEVRPGYLQLKELGSDVFSVAWKVPAKGNKKLGLDVRMPGNCKGTRPPESRIVNGAFIQQWIVNCENGLVDKEIAIAGLRTSSTDVLVHIEFNDGLSRSAHLTPDNFSYRVPPKTSKLDVVTTYTVLGIQHILLGIDHLLFVFALLLIVKNWRRLVTTITAFTIAHSITLAAATLGFVHVPQQPVEAVIALSILFLAVEIVHEQQGRSGYAARWPWLVAFLFGLLHGFGFAGALAEVGLPQQAIPLALVFFNVGVEIGQLLFIVIVLLSGWMLRQMQQSRLLERVELAAIYSIGGLSSFWLFQRISLF